MTRFSLTFSPDDIDALAARYAYASDAALRVVGDTARRRGHYTRDEFLAVCEWKTSRSRPKVGANTEGEVQRSTAQAFAAEDEKARMETLLALSGVGVPTASTLLHFAFPDDYPILDVRALASLGQAGSTTYSVSYWLDYLGACRELARDLGISIRTLDKALWQHSKEQSN